MSHIIILGETFDCAGTAATNAGENPLAVKLTEIRLAGEDLQRKKFGQLSEQHEQQEEAITNANNFAQSVCDGNTSNRMDEANSILAAINALL